MSNGSAEQPGEAAGAAFPGTGHSEGLLHPFPRHPRHLRGHGRSRRAPPRAPQPRCHPARPRRCRASSPHPRAGDARRSPHPCQGSSPRHPPPLTGPGRSAAPGSGRGMPAAPGTAEINPGPGGRRCPQPLGLARRGSARLSPAGLSSPPQPLPECGERGSDRIRPPQPGRAPRSAPAPRPGALPAPLPARPRAAPAPR